MKNQPFIKYFPLVLLGYHLLFAYAGWEYILKNNGDATRYWFVGQDLSGVSWSSFFLPGTAVVKVLTFPLVKYLNLPFWSGFLLFSLFSFSGVWLLYRLLLKIAGDSLYLWFPVVLLLFLPNLHFWTALISKEALLFPFLTVFLWEVIHKRYFSILLFIALFLVALIRPHVAIMLLLAYFLSLLITKTFSRVFALKITGAFLVLSGLFALVLFRIQDFSGGFQQIAAKYSAHIDRFQRTDAYVPLDRYPLPYKIFTFYFRPLPLEHGGLYYAVISIENAVLLILFGVFSAVTLFSFRSLKNQMSVVFPFLFLLVLVLVYGYAYANYGIIMRTKSMAAPFIYVLTAGVMVKIREILLNRQWVFKK